MSFAFTLTPELRTVHLVDVNDVFVDCVRRMWVSTKAKLFVIDDLSYSISTATDDVCGTPAGSAQANGDTLIDLTSAASSRPLCSWMFSGGLAMLSVTAALQPWPRRH